MDNNKNSEKEDKLYNSVFNNIFLKRKIFDHLTLYDILSINIPFSSIKEWEEFKYKEYLYKVEFSSDFYLLTQLPENIKQVTLPSFPPPPKEYSNHIASLLENVESILLDDVEFEHLESPIIKSLVTSPKTKINTFILSTNLGNQFQSNTLPESITGLEIDVYSNFKVLKNILPAKLDKLSLTWKIEEPCIVDFEEGSLPESLTHITLVQSIPLYVNKLSSFVSLNNLVKLFYIDFSSNFDSTIVFPNTLQEIRIGCRTFNSKLPDKLKKLDFSVTYHQHHIKFPSSLENLVACYSQNTLDQEFFLNRHSVPPNLKILRISCSSIVGDDGVSILPDSLEKLYIEGDFNKEIKVNQLPQSLKVLHLGYSFNQVIGVNVLPANLKKLILSIYTKEIEPLAIPQNLQLLKILNSSYQYQIKLTPTTHPFTFICGDNISQNLYYKPSNTNVRVLRTLDIFNSPLSTLQLQDKSYLEYLHLGYEFNHPIQLSDLPTKNNIKTLELSSTFKGVINLEYFQNLETIIINHVDSTDNESLKIITTTIKDFNNNIIKYNNYKLKNIIIQKSSTQIIKNLDFNFYQFLKLKNKNI